MKKSFITIALLASACIAFADDTTPAAKLKKPAVELDQPDQLPEVLVTPTRNPQVETKLGSAASLIDADEIRRTQSVDLQQSLNMTPGIFAADAGARGGLPITSIRGTRGSDTLIMLDGVQLNTGINPDAKPFLAYAGTDNLQTIEIVRGPQSTLYGSQGIGGVISLETKKGEGAPSGDIFGEGGSFDSYRTGISSQGTSGKSSYDVSYERDATSNDRPNNALWLDRYSLRFDYQALDNLSLTLFFSGLNGHYQEPGSDRPQDFASNDPSSYAIGQSNLISGIINWKVTDFWTQKLTLGVYFERYVFMDPPYAGNFFDPTDYISDAINYTADWQNTFQITSNNRLTAGIDFKELTGHDNSFSNQQVSDWAGYVQDEWEPVKNLNLTGGMRYDGYELAGDAFTYRLTGAYLFPQTDTKIRSSYGTAFNAPSFFELFSTSSFATGNPNLMPEKSRGWDAGIDQYFLDRHVTLSATYFRNNLRDLIAFVPTSSETGFYENENSGESQGVEFSALLNLYHNWNTEISYTYTSSTQTTANVTQQRDEIPRNDLNLDTSYLFCDKLQVGCGVSFIGGRVDTDFSTFPSSQVKLPNYWTARIYSRYMFNDHFSIFARVENVTNTHYEDALGYPGLPIGVYGGAEIKF